MRLMVPLLLGVLTVTACQSKDAGDWRVTLQGYGPIHAGMTLDEAAAAGGRPFGGPQMGSEECDYVFFSDDTVSGGVHFMVVDGRIARVDIQDSTITTSHGARIGDSEERVKKLYPGRVTVKPHKYTDGHYLVVATGRASRQRPRAHLRNGWRQGHHVPGGTGPGGGVRGRLLLTIRVTR